MRRLDDMPVLEALLRLRHGLLALVAAALLLASWAGTPTSTDWLFFTWGSDTLLGADRDFVRGEEVIPSSGASGFHLYAAYPFLQIGPPALLLAAVLQLGPADGVYLAGAVIQLLGLGTVLVLEQLAGTDLRRKLLALVGGTLLLAVWTGLAHTRHLDDALALSAMAAGCAAMARRQPLLAGALLGLASASKPWAVGALPVLLAFTCWRDRAVALATAIGCVSLFWGPFVLADPGTLNLGNVQLPFGSDSAPAALGAEGVAPEQNLRLVQFLGGMLVAATAVLLGGWAVAPLCAFSVRLLLEPFPYQYYMASLAAAALLADLQSSRLRFPAFTALVVGAWAAVSLVPAETGGLIRLLAFSLCLGGGLTLAWCRWRRRISRPEPELCAG